MSVAEFKTQAQKLSPKELRELSVYFHGLALKKKTPLKNTVKFRPPIAPSDPLLNLDKFAVEGPGGSMSNADIDRLLYGRS